MECILESPCKHVFSVLENLESGLCKSWKILENSVLMSVLGMLKINWLTD